MKNQTKHLKFLKFHRISEIKRLLDYQEGNLNTSRLRELVSNGNFLK
jgi:hypothetical protein